MTKLLWQPDEGSVAQWFAIHPVAGKIMVRAIKRKGPYRAYLAGRPVATHGGLMEAKEAGEAAAELAASTASLARRRGA